MEPSTGSDLIAKLLRDAGAADSVVTGAGDPGLEDSLLSELEGISKELPKMDEGGTRVIVAGRFVNLGEAAWKLVVSVTALGISSLDPTGITRVAALTVGLDFLKELRPLLKKLDPGKLLVCAAIGAVSAEKKRNFIAESGASEQDIRDNFTAKGEIIPPNLSEILKSLESDKVLEAIYYQSSGPFYSIKF